MERRILTHSFRTAVKSSNLLLEAVVWCAHSAALLSTLLLSRLRAVAEALSEAMGKGLARWAYRCFAALILRCAQDDSEGTAQVRSRGKSSLHMSEVGLCILSGEVGERADKSAVAAINRALRFTRKHHVSADRDEDENAYFVQNKHLQRIFGGRIETQK